MEKEELGFSAGNMFESRREPQADAEPGAAAVSTYTVLIVQLSRML
jgi:hypothetical protein